MSEFDDSDVDLSGRILISMPNMGDPRFARSVVYICAHSPEGAMGLIVNKPSHDVEAIDLLKQLGITPGPAAPPIRVHFGGPVEHGRGFVLHSTDYVSGEATLKVDAEIGMTATIDILEAMARGDGPRESLLALGYSGWGPGQLEGEIQQNGWLICDATPELIFDEWNDNKWESALATLGIDPLLLSAEGGSA